MANDDRAAQLLQRAYELLRATEAFASQDGVYDYQVKYDGVQCDGICLSEDCKTAAKEIADHLGITGE